MENYYTILGVSSAATSDELRRAYRILARRYHPDMNPDTNSGERSAERFKKIAEAYSVLQDPAKRRAHDADLERYSAEQFTSSFDKAHKAYRKQQSFEDAFTRAEARTRTRGPSASGRSSASRSTHSASTSTTTSQQQQQQKGSETGAGGFPGSTKLRSMFTRSSNIASALKAKISKFPLHRLTPKGGSAGATEGAKNGGIKNGGAKVTQISILEVSISVLDAIKGLRKTVEIQEETTIRKISVIIPPGVRSGSVIRFRRREAGDEEIVILIRVASHPALSISSKGLVMEVPITVKEAVTGARIKVPTLEDSTTVFIEPGTQSGTEIRLRGQGIPYRDGTKGDLFVRVMIRVPTTLGAVGLEEKCNDLEMYYERGVRSTLPNSILEM